MMISIGRAIFWGVLFWLATMASAMGQSTDLARVEFLHIPQNDTGIQTSKYRILINAPIKLNAKSYLTIGADYNQFNNTFTKPLPFNSKEIERLKILDANLGFITKLKNNWRFVGIATPRLASTDLTDSNISNDFFFNATAAFWKSNSKAAKPSRLILGLSYNSTTGLPFPLPVISYRKRFHPNWSYTLGIPSSNFNYHPTQKHTLQLALLLDGYFINIQEDIALADGAVASRISLSALVANIGYRYKIHKNMAFYAMVGRSLVLESMLRDDDRNDLFLLNNQANFFLRTGFRVSIF